MADLEDGLWACEKPRAINPLVVPMRAPFVTGMVKGQPGVWAIKAGNATGGPLVTSFEGPRPPGYAPMRKQGAIILGIGACPAALKHSLCAAQLTLSTHPDYVTGGDNSDSATSVWFEGVMTAGYSADATDDAVQADIVSVYGAA